MFEFIIIIIVVAAISCGTDGEVKPNETPKIEMVNIPTDSSILTSAIEIPLFGRDVDGKIEYYQYADVEEHAVKEETFQDYYESPELIPNASWHSTNKDMDTIYLSYNQIDYEASRPTKHLFCIRTFDNADAGSNIDCRILYRTNVPPDSIYIIRTPYGKVDALADPWTELLDENFWCLNYKTSSWDGLNFSWAACDPDNPFIMEYKWVIVNREDRADTIQTSYVDDYGENKGFLGANAASDDTSSRDGWITYTYTSICSLKTSGKYVFIVQARDDAKYVSPKDSVPLNVHHPYFDVSDSSISVEDIEQNVLIIRSPIKDVSVPDGAFENSVTFYENIFDELRSEGIVDNFNLLLLDNINDIPDSLPKLLPQYNITYWYHLGKSTGQITSDIAAIFENYLLAGGRLFIDGRDCVIKLDDAAGGTGAFTYKFLGLQDFATITPDGANQHFARAIPSQYDPFTQDLPTLAIDSSKAPGPPHRQGYHALKGRYGSANSFSQILYYYECNDLGEGEPMCGKPCAVRYVTSTFQTATFQVPLYYMHADSSEVVIRKIIDSFGDQWPVEDDD